MPKFSLSIAAANLTANKDLIENAQETWKPAKNVNRDRMISYAGLSGSAAAGDMMVEVRANSKPLGMLRNTSTSIMTSNDELFPVGIRIPANTDFEVIVTDAGGTNPAYLELFMDE